MSQYTTGTVSVLSGNATISGNGTTWLGNVSAGSVFSVLGSKVPYIVGNVAGNGTATLTAPYAGSNSNGLSYAITTSFTPNRGIPYMEQGDVDTATIFKEAMLLLDDTIFEQYQGADIASAANVNLETATGDLVDVTGNVTITSITLSQGHERTVRFTGTLVLTNGASLVLPGGSNITTAAGDFAVFRGYAAGVVRCVDYSRANGSDAKQDVKAADVASNATINLTTATGDLVDVTGTTTITAITLADGIERTVRFTGSLTLTNGASLLLPDQGNIQTAAGDLAIFRGYAAGVVRCVNYLRLNRKASDIASNATVNLNASAGDLADITGNTTITAVTLAEGREFVARFTGALTLTNGANLVLPGSANILTAAGDFAIFRGYAAGVVRCINYEKAAGVLTWTPSVGGNATYTTQTGRYVKDGKRVTAWGKLVINAIGSGSQSTISGLPFPSFSSGYATGGSMGFFGTLASNVVFIQPIVNNNASTVSFITLAAAGSNATSTPNIMTSGTEVNFSVTYEAA